MHASDTIPAGAPVRALLAIVALAGCADAPAARATVEPDTTALSPRTAATPHRAAGDDYAYMEQARDLGIGVLHLGFRPDSIAGIREDTVIVRDAPTDGAAIIARWVHRYGDAGTWEYRLETSEAGLLRNDVEWSYEENGLPVDTIAADGRWARTVYALGDDGNPRAGWTRITERTTIERWPDVLTEQSIFFRNPDSVAFHVAPGGEAMPLEITAGDTSDGLDYAMQPLRVSDGWMQVVVTSPSDYCADAPAVRADTTWIRYLDDRGRPRVWYYPRGC